MARRVNTKFVVILSSVLVGAAAVFGGVLLFRSMRKQDPDYVRGQADTAERAGDLKTAAEKYSSAAAIMSRKHISGADAMFAKAAELCMKISREAQTQQDAVLYYQMAVRNYDAALTENPRNKEVNQTLLEEDYQDALLEPSSAAWKEVANKAGALIKNQDGLKPRLYRAEALLNLAMQTTDASTLLKNMTDIDKNISGIDADLKAALTYDQKSGKARALSAQLIWYQANVSAARRGLTKIGELNSDSDFQYLSWYARQGLVNSLENRAGLPTARDAWLWPCDAGWASLARLSLGAVDSDVASELADLTIQQFQSAGLLNRDRLAGATDLLDAARKTASPSARNTLTEQLGQIYRMTGQLDKAEKLYREFLDAPGAADAPDAPQNQFRLANYYRDTGRLPEAIPVFQEVVRHTQIGGGREAKRNQSLQITSYNEIAWLNLELATRPGASDDDRNGFLKAAADATDKLRADNAPRGLIDLLDGRTQLIHHDLAHALVTLRSAEANLRGAEGSYMREKYRATELLLAGANEEENQLGAALDMLNKALEIQPNDAAVLLHKGQLQLRLGKFDEAQRTAEKILGQKDAQQDVFSREGSLPPEVAKAARQIWKLSDYKLNPEKYKDTPVLAGDPLRTAQLQLDAGDYAAALLDAKTVLEKAAGNSDADNLAAYQVAISCCIQLKQTPEAKALVAEALAKYPQNASFQVVKGMLDAGEVNSFDELKAVYSTITDPYAKAQSLAALYYRQAQPTLQKDSRGLAVSPAERTAALSALDMESKILLDARELFKNDPDKLNGLLDRQFDAVLSAGTLASDDAKRAGYWKDAQAVVGELEKLNLDGTDGKLYQGRLDLAQSNGQKGLQLLQQAVAQRPDYASAHLILGQAYLSRSNMEPGVAATTDANAALDEFHAVVRLAPNNLLALQRAIELLVKKGDPASLTEAQTLLQSGLAQAPHNSVLITYQEFFPDRVDDAIASREETFKLQPEDRNNIHRLAALYIRKVDRESDPDTKLKAQQRAIELIKQDYESHRDAPEALALADLLAHYLVAYQAPPEVTSSMDVEVIQKARDVADAAVANAANAAIDLYAPFVVSDKPDVRFAALIGKAEFFHTLLLPPGAMQILERAKVVTHDNLRDEAADILQEAIKIEPAGTDDAERHLADMYFELGRFADAEKIYQQVLTNNRRPDDMDRVNRRLIEAELRQAKYADAEPRLATLLKNHETDVQGLILRAFASLEHGLAAPEADHAKWLKTALTDLNQALQLAPGNPDALYYRALAELALGDQVDDAEHDFIEAGKRDKTGVNSRIQLAELYARTSRFEEASQQYSEILKMHPELLAIRMEYTDLLMSLAQLQASQPANSEAGFVVALRRLNPLDKLSGAISDAEKLYPNQLRWPLLYAQSLEVQGKNAEALRWYKSLYDNLHDQHVLDPELCDVYLGALLKNKEYDKVVELSTSLITTYMDFITKNPQYVSFFLKRAVAYQAMGNHQQEAVQDIDQAFAVGVKAVQDANNVGPYIAVLGAMASDDTAPDPDNRLLDAALLAQRLRERLKTNPTETISQIGLIQTLMTMHDAPGALKVVDTLAVPADNPVLRYLVIRESALVRAENRQYAAADKDYQELLKTSPDNLDVLNNYAFMLAQAGRIKEGITYGEKAVKTLTTHSDPSLLAQSPANVYDTLGWAYYLNNEFSKAEGLLRQSVSMQPHAVAYLHLALTQQKLGGASLDGAVINCREGIRLAEARHDEETLKALRELQAKIDPDGARTDAGASQPDLKATRP